MSVQTKTKPSKTKGNSCQCRLERPGVSRYAHLVQTSLTDKDGKPVSVYYSWLPQRFARVGHYVKLKMEDGNWEDGWKVVEAGPPKPSSEVEMMSQFAKSHRDGTDQYRDKNGQWVTRKQKKKEKG